MCVRANLNAFIQLLTPKCQACVHAYVCLNDTDGLSNVLLCVCCAERADLKMEFANIEAAEGRTEAQSQQMYPDDEARVSVGIRSRPIIEYRSRASFDTSV